MTQQKPIDTLRQLNKAATQPGATAWAIARAITWAITVTVWNGLAAYEMLQLFATGDGKRIWGVMGCLFIAAFVGVMAAQKRK